MLPLGKDLFVCRVDVTLFLHSFFPVFSNDSDSYFTGRAAVRNFAKY